MERFDPYRDPHRDPHRFDVRSDYCVRCGMSREEAVEMQRHSCRDRTNLIPISHLIAARRFEDLVKAVIDG